MAQNQKPLILLVACSIHKKGNSEIALEYAEEEIKKYPVKIEKVVLNRYFLKDGSHRNIQEVVDKVRKADGILFSTPVYFGAWTSLAQDLLEEMRKRKVSLFPKVVAFISVGAKRNGGQETTILFAGWDLMNLGACLVNDGYPISQFGGTCMAGAVGTMRHDEYGKNMCRGVGKRIAETALILKAGDYSAKVKKLNWPLKGKFHRCWACAVCPNPVAHKRGDDYKCRNYGDDMHKLHSKIVNANLIIPTGYDLKFEERTRYLRRDNYRLTYHIAYVSELRYFPLFIKLNCILARKHLEKYAKLIQSGRERIKTSTPIYQPIGHENPYLK
jgi:multimeric flavodoxin WrbA